MAVVLGALAYVTKITTVVAVLAASLPFWLDPARTLLRTGIAGVRIRALGVLAPILGAPFAAGWAWTGWADHIKGAQSTTAMLTSARLHAWNFGTLPQRLRWSNWETILGRVEPLLLPGTLALSIPLALVLLLRAPRELRRVVIGAMAGALAPILVFFNLYWVHDH